MEIVGRKLDGLTLNLSVSESAEAVERGFPPSESNRTVLRIVAAILGHGAKIVLGHDWRDDGLMEAVHSYVIRYRSVTDVSQNLVTNILPWPDKSKVSEADQKTLKGALRIVALDRPIGIRDSALKVGPLARSVSLTAMRIELTRKSDARLCMGGRTQNYQGRLPGVLEEALLSLRAKKPLYLAGIWGGAAERTIALLRGEKRTWLEEMSTTGSMLSDWPPQFANAYSRYIANSVQAISHTFQVGVEGLAKANFLTVSENEQLFKSQSIDEIVELILAGMYRSRRTR
jgi:hypothetical protein